MSLVLIPDGPGTTVELREAAQGLPPAPRGTSALVGQFASGPVTRAAISATPALSRLISGDPDDNFEASLALDDVYSLDTPTVLIARVTDGLEVKARADLWDRNPSRSFSRGSPALNTDRAPLAQAFAQNGGRWGGRKRVLVGDLNAIATDLTSTTVDLATAAEIPATMLENVLAGALLYLEGDTSSPYEIVSNTTAGIATIKGEFSQAAQDATGSGAIDGRFRIVLDHDKELSVVVAQDTVVGSRFSLTAMRKFKTGSDFEVVSRYDGLALSQSDDRPWIRTISDGEENKYQLEIETAYAGETVETFLPCNFSEVPTAVSGATLTYQWYRWSRGAGSTGTGRIISVSPVDAGSVEPHVYVLTFTAATTFDVAVTWPDGTSQTLTSGTVATPYSPGHPQLAGFNVIAGGVAFIAGDTLKLRINSLPHDLYRREAYLYPVLLSADGNSNQRLRIVSNTYNSVTVRSDLDLADYDSEAGASPDFVCTQNLSAVTSTIGHTVILTPDGMPAVTLTFSTAVLGATLIAAALTALDTNSIFVFSAGGTGNNFLRIRLNGSYGTRTSILTGAGTGHTALGITNATTHLGSDGVPFRIEARWPMWGGYDGAAPATARYVIGLDLDSSLFQCHMNRNLGLVTVATPGVNATAVKDAAGALVAKNGWQYVAEFASSIESLASPGEGAVDDMVTNESESDFVLHLFPSRAKFLSVDKTRLVTRSLSGMWLGLRSRMANVGIDGEKGYHIATANNNPQGKLSPRVKGLSDELGRWTPPIKLLNDNGIVPVIWSGPDVYLFGNRMYSAGRTPEGRRYTITERSVHYHIARDMFVTTRPFIFKSISARRLGDVQVALRTKMKSYYNDGWFSDLGGTAPGFEQQVLVEVPLALNPPEALLEGQVTASVKYRPRPALEDLKIILSPTELTANG
jgi:hypothetical protein